ncbi:hypothetical protein P3T73_18310 [Kiritimatiellota bacterium B12222]|nr:hypothetical protein P3T73_18310 [Kiritimatiellota bacterium B12222]
MSTSSSDSISVPLTDSTRTLREEAKGLLALLNEMDPGEPLWSHEDLESILSHQMEAPLLIDLGSMHGVNAEQVQQLASTRGLVLRSFEDLLTHPHPPVELLIFTKEFAKRNLASPRSPIPAEVARILYFSCISSAMLKCGRKISQLSLTEIGEGIDWCLHRPWLQSEWRELFKNTKGFLEERGEA